MARNSTVLATFCLTEHVIHNVLIGELINIKGNSTIPEVFHTQKQDVCTNFPEWNLKTAISKVLRILCSDILKDKCNIPSKKVNDTPITFSTTHSLQFRQIVRIIKKHLHLLAVEDNMQEVLNSGMRFIYRKASTVANLISPSLFTCNTSMPVFLPKVFTAAVINNVLHAISVHTVQSFQSSINGMIFPI